jgi:hypothetical protein
VERDERWDVHPFDYTGGLSASACSAFHGAAIFRSGLSDKEFSVDGVRFLCALDDYSLKTNDDRLVILKDRESLESYAAVFSGTHPRTMLEFGIFQGGSPALFSLWFEIDKFVGIDLSAPIEEFDAFCNRHAVGRKIRTYYGISQTDKRPDRSDRPQ